MLEESQPPLPPIHLSQGCPPTGIVNTFFSHLFLVMLCLQESVSHYQFFSLICFLLRHAQKSLCLIINALGCQIFLQYFIQIVTLDFTTVDDLGKHICLITDAEEFVQFPSKTSENNLSSAGFFSNSKILLNKLQFSILFTNLRMRIKAFL